MSLASDIARRSAKRLRTSDDIDGSGSASSEANEHHTPQSADTPSRSFPRVQYGPGPLVGIKQHPEFWLDDGNLVLVANRHTAFRVYAGLLASQSEVFANMFAVASSNADEVYDGCPVVPVYDVPSDFAHFLRVLLPKESRTFYRTAKWDGLWTFDAAAAVLRLAHKYALPGLRDQALELIERHAFPGDGPVPPLLSSNSKPALAFEPVHAIAAANIARLVDRPAMRLAALYRCAALGPAVLRGWARDDGSVERLDPADLRVCMDAHAALVRERAALCATVFDDTPHGDCATRRQCQEALRRLEDAVVGMGFWSHGPGSGIVDEWGTYLWKRATDSGLCRGCYHMVETRDREERRKAWERLPEIFNVEVEGWKESLRGWL
ncbi:hypothetical protein GSI_12316 [Ganoderma sinense ZZ0214-1]|uniref:BTB domain-containing protein n=1 Tax=Ganoderma sinense ZZ0214-1 TaxID=1077348 RepID=A0A2G8RZ10_9APHY|nr:hypothetical protein GSI_12316 [Ganoderma sinense ZZ0214-1]